MSPRHQLLDYTAIAICTLAWGTTWFAITLQFGVVDPVVSIVYRFALASALLFFWGALRTEPIKLSRAQHAGALGVGVFGIAMDHSLTYWGEECVASGVVAVIFAALAIVNLITFRIAFRQGAPRSAWMAARVFRIGTDAATILNLNALNPLRVVLGELPSEQPQHEVNLTKGY